MPATDQQLRAIAFLAKDCRPHGATLWDEPGIFENAARIRHWNLRELTIEVVSAAADRSAKTPGVIGKPGPHRHLDTTEPTTADKVPPADHCATCGHTETACRIRWAGDHEFVTVAQARAHKRTPDAAADIHEALAAEVKPMREPTHDATTVTPGAGRARLGEQATETTARPTEDA